MTYLKLLSSPMLCGWRWYTMRLSDFARSRQTSSVSSVEALSEMTSSRFSWSCARTERTTSATRGPASRTGRPIDTSASAFDMRTPFSGRLRLRRTEVHVAQERQQGHGDRCASGQRQQAPRKEHGGASVTAARHVQLEADDGRCAGESEYRNGGVRTGEHPAKRTSSRRRQGRLAHPTPPGQEGRRGARIADDDQVRADGVAGTVPARRHGRHAHTGGPERGQEHDHPAEPVRRHHHESTHQRHRHGGVPAGKALIFPAVSVRQQDRALQETLKYLSGDDRSRNHANREQAQKEPSPQKAY